MKSLVALITAGLVTLASVSQVAAAPLPAKVKAELSTALAKVDKSDEKAVTKAVLALIASYPSLAADITGAAVASLGNSRVIPGLVAAVNKAYPAQAEAITKAAIANLQTKNPEVVREIVNQSVDAVRSAQTKADVLNGALAAVQGISSFAAMIDQIAQANQIVLNADGTSYLVPAEESADNSGVTAPLQGTTLPNSGGGSGASGTQPAPAS